MRRRTLEELRRDGDERWFAPALEGLARLSREDDARLADFIDATGPLRIARAPGRLDVMGGIADYSGSLVLQLPLARATFAVLQPREGREIGIVSMREAGPSFHLTTLDGAAAVGEGLPVDEVDGAPPWTRYVTGVIGWCLRQAGAEVASRAAGFRLLVLSDVPEGKGVSSSAALEVAVMTAVADHLGVELSGQEIAAACQWVENHVVGAPCGIMDQLTSALGERDRLLRIRCQPAVVEGTVEIPPEYRFFGIDSGVRHAVSGADYGTVRAAAFMGRALIQHVLQGGPRPVPEDSRRGAHPEYLASLSLGEFEALEKVLPERMSGAEFLARFGGHGDPATRVDPAREYPVRAATRHPVLENARVERFARLLRRLRRFPAAALEMGELMYASHASYGACGLGSEATDRLVEGVREIGSAGGLFGAKITGGGSGGTVAIFGLARAEATVRRLAAESVGEREVFVESGPGAEMARRG